MDSFFFPNLLYLGVVYGRHADIEAGMLNEFDAPQGLALLVGVEMRHQKYALVD